MKWKREHKSSSSSSILATSIGSYPAVNGASPTSGLLPSTAAAAAAAGCYPTSRMPALQLQPPNPVLVEPESPNTERSDESGDDADGDREMPAAIREREVVDDVRTAGSGSAAAAAGGKQIGDERIELYVNNAVTNDKRRSPPDELR